MPFNIHVGDHDGSTVTGQPSMFSTPIFRAAIKLGGITAVAIVAINLFIFAAGGSSGAWSHMLIFLILFIGIAYGMYDSRSWLNEKRAFQDRMIFGMLAGIAVSFFLMAINGLLALIDYNLIVSEISLPIDDGLSFAVSSMGLFLGCLGYGFLSAFILNFVYADK